MLSLRAVNQFYGSQHTLWNVDLDFPQGMCTGVVGLPGMGKTTLMNCIAGKLPVESGTIIWHEAGAPPRDLLSQPPNSVPAGDWLRPAGQADLLAADD
jgi:ABC-type branched-subunit amino acid transport system ATPase component